MRPVCPPPVPPPAPPLQPESQRKCSGGGSPRGFRVVAPGAGLPGREAAGAAVEGVCRGAGGSRESVGGERSEGQAGTGSRVPADVPKALLFLSLHRVRTHSLTHTRERREAELPNRLVDGRVQGGGNLILGGVNHCRPTAGRGGRSAGRRTQML